MIHRIFDYSLHRIIKRWWIWAAKRPLDCFSEKAEFSLQNDGTSILLKSHIFFYNKMWNNRKSEVIKYFQITFPGHSNFEEIWTDHVSRAYGNQDSTTRAVHGFLEVKVRIAIIVRNIVVYIMSFNIKHYKSWYLMV